MTGPVDPARAFAVAVGIERYDDDYLPDLPGAAAAAMRFADWAARWIPAERIRLICNWIDAPPGNLPYRRVGTALHQIKAELYDSVAKADGDQLFLYWFGHGAMDDERRILFTSDARKANMENVDVDDLLAFLGSQSVVGLSRQIVLIDACANFFPVGPGLATLPEAKLAKGASRSVLQYSAYAAGRGEKAAFDRTKRTALFSQIAFEWLDAQLALPADGGALHAQIAKRYEQLPFAERSHTPVLKLHGPGVVRDFGGVVPVPGDVFDAMRDAVLTESLAQGFAERIVSSGLLGSAAARSRLATELDGPGPADMGSRELAYALMPRFARGQGSAVLDALARSLETATEADRLEVFGFRQEYQRLLELAAVARALERTTTSQVREAFATARPFKETRIPRDLDEALTIVAEHANNPRESGPLTRFVATLEHLSGEAVPDQWYQLSAAKLATLRSSVTQGEKHHGHLVVWFPWEMSGVVWPENVKVSFKRAGQDWEPIEVPYVPGVDGARAAVLAAIDAAQAQGFADFTVGIVLPRKALDCMPEEWPCLDEFAEQSQLGVVHPVILHFADRFRAPMAQRWREKSLAIGTRLLQSSPDVDWDVAAAGIASIATAVENTNAAYIGLTFAVNEVGDARTDPIAQVVKGGAPYIVWLSDEPGDWAEAKSQLLELLTPFDKLPMRLRALRAAGGSGLARSVRVIWDNPDCLPDAPMQYAGMAAQRSGSG